MKALFNGQLSKFLVALGQAAMVGLTTYYSGAKWEPLAAALIGAVLVYMVPNSPKSP